MAEGDSPISRGTLAILGVIGGIVLIGLFVFTSLMDRKPDPFYDQHSAGQGRPIPEQLRGGENLWHDPHAPRPYLGPDTARPSTPAVPKTPPPASPPASQP